MFNTITADFKNAFFKRDNQVIQLLIVMVAWFLLKLIFGAVLPIYLKDFDVTSILNLSNDFNKVIRSPWSFLFFPVAVNGFLSLLFGALIIFSIFEMLSNVLGSYKTLLATLIGAYVGGLSFILTKLIGVWLGYTVPSALFFNGYSLSIFSLIFATISLLPNAEIRFFTINIKLRYIGLFFLILSAFSDIKFAHVYFIAAVSGYFYIYLLQNDIKLFKNKKKGREIIFKPIQKKTYNEFIGQKSYYPSQEEIDFLLDKINKKGGYDALSSEEKERLNRASETHS